MEQDQNIPESSDDVAISRRLRQLSSLPVDTSGLEARLRASLPPRRANLPGFRSLFTPMRALAASILILVGLATLIITLASGPASASTERMAAIHQSAVAGDGRTTRVSSIAEARAALQRKWPGTPELPELPEHRAMSCCVHEIGREQMASITFEVEGSPVTMALASSRDIRMPHGEKQEIAGKTYVVGSASGVNMVMSQRDGTWMCLMGRLSLAQLAQLSESLRDN